MPTLEQIKNQLRTLLIEAPDRVFAVAHSHLPPGSKKKRTLLLLQGRYQDMLQKVQKGVMSAEDQRLETNRIREQMLVWIEDLEEKDLVGEEAKVKRRKPYFLVSLLGILVLGVLVLGFWYLRSGEPEVRESATDLDTIAINTTIPFDSAIVSNGTQEERIQTVEDSADVPVPIVQNAPPETPATVQVKINVLPLWKDSDISVDGQRVEPLERIGTYITLALSLGSHKIQLIAGEERCKKNIRVREADETIPVVCD